MSNFEFLRHMLAQHFGGDLRMIAHFEEQAETVEATSEAASATAEATDALQDALVIVLSSNKAFTNERLLRRGPGVKMVDTGKALIVELDDRLKPLTDPVTLLGNYANDGAAAAGGVGIGSFYRNGSVVMVRVA